eukprot:2150237-Prymnesium_polylepis.1
MSGERSPKPTTTRPPRGGKRVHVSCLGLWCLGRVLGFRGVSRLFTGGAGRRRLFGGALDSPSKRGTSRYGSGPSPKRVTQ